MPRPKTYARATFRQIQKRAEQTIGKQRALWYRKINHWNQKCICGHRKGSHAITLRKIATHCRFAECACKEFRKG